MLLLSLFSLLLTAPATPAPDWRTPFERGNGNTTATYDECIAYYQRLDAAYPEIQLSEAGTTDSGRPLHVVVLSGDGDTDPVSLRAKGRRIVFIQNGIHPGEPEGIDASLMLTRDYVQQKALHRQLDDVVLVIIPIYNVGGALNRNTGTRTNQNGPESYGFRGNARNLDLNRDYIKQDSRNARSFAALFQRWQPDVYVDTHTSNGADYQYTLTLIATQKDKLHPALSQYMQQELLPALYGGMDQKKWYLTPYVDFAGRTPDARGLVGFLETPRYSTGYTTLFNTIGFVTETHMLKAYTPRVRATYDFLSLLIGTVQRQRVALAAARATATLQTQQQQQFALGWRLDTTAAEQFTFRGYAGKTKTSDVSAQPRLYYDRQAPYTKPIPYYNTFRPTTTVQRPRAYVVPQAWGEVVERLRLSGVQLRPLSMDTVINGETYYIEDYKTGSRPYEGHYLHTGVQVRTVQQPRSFLRGDYYVSLDQPAARYLIETLEPQATDSFFAWGFFDSMLQQKEHFSDYVFEDLAANLLRQQPALRAQFDQKKQADPAFAASGPAQLDWIYQQSDHYEPSYLRYPVLRVR
ncbi:hypothetical protein CDA63_02030 [Hymenobacter amundsenii]|uniref:Peptidase M14 domain-containing protein n=1 Tax=Hymenobacter amundsenii TaxID=2006685 RepID=A0A246FQZ7_9BACT|nr:M14 family metallopeptidase [Hymenobacter amundsenii]OWP65155.1 hypothetical protein CDA63_02030 [Hymenobacter amundsenii]